MLSPTEMLEALALDQFVVRPNMSKTTKYKFVVLRKEVTVKQEGGTEPATQMKCAAQFETEEDAQLWAQAKRKQFVAQAMGKTVEIIVK